MYDHNNNYSQKFSEEKTVYHSSMLLFFSLKFQHENSIGTK